MAERIYHQCAVAAGRRVQLLSYVRGFNSTELSSGIMGNKRNAHRCNDDDDVDDYDVEDDNDDDDAVVADDNDDDAVQAILLTYCTLYK